MLYLAFSAPVVALNAADFPLPGAQGAPRVSVREAAGWSVVWLLAALVFCAWFWCCLDGPHGREVASREALQCLTGNFIEKGPAMENVFVRVTTFTFFAVPPQPPAR